jgi:high-affinity iron transporter
VIPGVAEPIWDISRVLPEDSMLGELLRALFGFNANPSLTEAVAYLAYLLGLPVVARLARPRQGDGAVASAA